MFIEYSSKKYEIMKLDEEKKPIERYYMMMNEKNQLDNLKFNWSLWVR